MLAQAARNENLTPLVIDLFADQDTQEIAEKVIQLQDLSLPLLSVEVLTLQSEYNIKSIVYGSGLESQHESLVCLEGLYEVCGNKATVNAQYAVNKKLLHHLDRLNIPYPSVSFIRPQNARSYLIKSSRMSGGQGVKFCIADIKEGEYYQQHQKGESGSVLFLAAQQGVQIIGFHKQWTLSATDFSFAGIIKQNILPAEKVAQVVAWLNGLVKLYGFKGLGGLDFIWDGEQCYFLEINCRPPASMMLYPELDLLSAHIKGEFVSENPDMNVKGLQVLYAIEDYRIQSPEWPVWSFDRPKNATRIKSNQPICSTMAAGKTVAQVEEKLRHHKDFIQNNVIK